MSLGDLVISLSANTASLASDMGKANQIMERFAYKAIQSAKQGEDAIKTMSAAGVTSVDRLKYAFQNLDIKSALNIEQEKARIIASFNMIKNSGVATFSEIARANEAMQSKLDLLDGKINKNTGGMNLFGLASVAAIAKIQILYSLINTVMSAIGQAPGIAIDAIETFNSQIVGNAAMITSMQRGVKDIGAAYLQNKAYAQSVQETLVKMDAETAASAQNLQDMNTQFMQQGVLIDVNNKKQVEGFKSAANALAAITANDPNRNMQFAQEIRALREMKDIGSNRLVQLLATQGVTKEIFENWKKTAQETGNYGYVLEKIGPYLQGFAAAQGDINNLWETIKSTMGTIVNEVLRGGLSKGFAELVEKMKELNKWATDNKEKIQAWLSDAWEKGKKVVEVFWEIAKLIAKFAEPLMWAAFIGSLFAAGVKAAALFTAFTKATAAVGVLQTGVALLGGEIALATGGATVLLGILTAGALKLRQMYNEQQDLNKRVWEIRNAGKSEAADFTPNMLKQVLDVNKNATNEDINKWLKSGALNISTRNGQQVFDINKAAVLAKSSENVPMPSGLSGRGLGKDKKAKSESVSAFNSYIESIQASDIQAEVDPYVRAWMELDKKYAELQHRFDSLSDRDKVALNKKGLGQSRIDEDRLNAEARLSAEELQKINNSNHKEETAWRKAELDDIKERSIYEQTKIKERLALTETEAKNNIANIQSLLTFGDISKAEAGAALLEQYQTIQTAQEEAAAGMDRGTTAWLTQQHAIDRTRDAILKLKKEQFDATVQGAMISSLKDYAASAMDVASQIKSATSGAFKSMEDAIVNFAKTGKLNFTDFANSVISDLIRIAVRASITGPLASALGNGITSIFGGLFSAAGGYDIPAGTNPVTQLHEKEMVLPAKYADTIRNLADSGSSSTPSVMVNIENRTNGEVKQGSTDVRFDGKQFVINTIIENVHSNGVLRGLMAAQGA